MLEILSSVTASSDKLHSHCGNTYLNKFDVGCGNVGMICRCRSSWLQADWQIYLLGIKHKTDYIQVKLVGEDGVILEIRCRSEASG